MPWLIDYLADRFRRFSQDAVLAVAASIQAQEGRLDVLVNSAGLNVRERNWKHLSTAGWDQVLRIDLGVAQAFAFAGGDVCAPTWQLSVVECRGEGIAHAGFPVAG